MVLQSLLRPESVHPIGPTKRKLFGGTGGATSKTAIAAKKPRFFRHSAEMAITRRNRSRNKPSLILTLGARKIFSENPSGKCRDTLIRSMRHASPGHADPRSSDDRSGNDQRPSPHDEVIRSASSRSFLIPSYNRDFTSDSGRSSTSPISARERFSTYRSRSTSR